MISDFITFASFFICLLAFLLINNIYMLKKISLGKRILKNIIFVIISPLVVMYFQMFLGKLLSEKMAAVLQLVDGTVQYQIVYTVIQLTMLSILLYLSIWIFSLVINAERNVCRFLYLMQFTVLLCVDSVSFNLVTVVIMSILMLGYNYYLFKNNLQIFQGNTDHNALKTINILPLAVLMMQYVLLAFWNLIPDDQAQNGVVTPMSIIMACFSVGLYVLLCLSYKIAFNNYEQKVRLIKDAEEKLKSQEEVILAFAEIIEAKSSQTGQHVKRVSEYSYVLAKGMGINEEEAQKIRVAAMMHDIGKLMIPSEILEKPGKLTPEEFDVIKTHVTLGENILHNAPGDIMAYAKQIALDHHEKWNGKGYLSKKENEISLSGRIVAVADVYDALVSKRSYKEAWTEESAKNQIITDSGSHFDPSVVEVFIRNYDSIRNVLRSFPDGAVAVS